MNSLRRLIEERGLAQGQLARMSGVGRESICKVSLGQRKFCHASDIGALAWALEIEPVDLEDVYEGRQPLPVGPNPYRATTCIALPPGPLAEVIRQRQKAQPFGSRGGYLTANRLPDPWEFARRGRVGVEIIEGICDRLEIHPVDVYGPDYHRVVA